MYDGGMNVIAFTFLCQ